jgi:squalene-hopene/tetraprenyl-beta-curcumene cyclase
MKFRFPIAAMIAVFMLTGDVAPAAEAPAYTTPDAKKPGRSDETMLPAFSLSKATEYLEAGAPAHEKNCVNCHGRFAYLAARPAIAGTKTKDCDARRSIEEFAAKWIAEKPGPQTKPLRVSEIVMAAAVLAQHDAVTDHKLAPVTRKTLDAIWELQREDGGWEWMKKDQAPSEIDDHFGVTMAAIGVGAAPEHYADTAQARKGLDGIRRYLRAHPPATMHQRGLLLLAAASVDGLLSEEEMKRTVADLFELQRPDGGWAMAALGSGQWHRADKEPLDPDTSDGYGTGFALLVLRNGGKVFAGEPLIQKGVLWLKSHQRSSGCWFTRSPHKNDELSTYAGTACALQALDACGALRPPSTGPRR